MIEVRQFAKVEFCESWLTNKLGIRIKQVGSTSMLIEATKEKVLDLAYRYALISAILERSIKSPRGSSFQQWCTDIHLLNTISVRMLGGAEDQSYMTRLG